MSLIPSVAPFDAAELSPIVLTYRGSQTDLANGPVYNSWSSFAIGAADPNRVVLIALRIRTGSPAITVEINGVSLTQLGIDTVRQAEIWGAYIPTGTTATLEMEATTTADSAWFAAWTLTNVASLTPVDLYEGDPVSGVTRDVDVAAGGAAVVIAFSNSDPTIAIGGDFTEQFDVNTGEFTGSTTQRFAGGSVTSLTEDIKSMVVTISGSTLASIVMVSMR